LAQIYTYLAFSLKLRPIPPLFDVKGHLSLSIGGAPMVWGASLSLQFIPSPLYCKEVGLFTFSHSSTIVLGIG